MSIVIRALGIVTKGLVKETEDLEIRGAVETIQQQHYRDRLEYREDFWRFEETRCHSNSSKRTLFVAGIRNT